MRACIGTSETNNDDYTVEKLIKKFKFTAKSNIIINAYSSNFEEIKTFEIVAANQTGYFIYVPHYIFLKDTILLDQFNYKKYNISSKFLGEKKAIVQS